MRWGSTLHVRHAQHLSSHHPEYVGLLCILLPRTPPKALIMWFQKCENMFIGYIYIVIFEQIIPQAELHVTDQLINKKTHTNSEPATSTAL